MPELHELDQIVEPSSGRGTPKEHIQAAIQMLQHHQIIYEDTHGAKTAYAVLLRHRPFFERYFDAAGRQIVFERREGMIALMPGPVSHAGQSHRLAKDETLVLLALRYLLEDGLKKGLITESGRVEATTDDLFDAIRTLASSEPPTEARMNDILKEFRRRGLVRIGQREPNERVTPIEVLPGARLICGDEFTRHVVAWAETVPEERGRADVFDFISTRRAAEASVNDLPSAEAPNGVGEADGDTNAEADSGEEA